MHEEQLSMQTQLVILGCLIGLIACLAVRVHMMTSEIHWIRTKMLETTDERDDQRRLGEAKAPSNRGGKGTRARGPRKLAQHAFGAVGADSHVERAPSSHMVASLIGSVVQGGLAPDVRLEADERDEFDEFDDDEDASALEHFHRLAGMRALEGKQTEGEYGSEELRIEDVTQSRAGNDDAASVDDDASSVELDEGLPPPD